MMQDIDLNKVLKDVLESIKPIAVQREIDLTGTDAGQAIVVSLPLDEVLGPVLWFLLRLIYIAPKGNNISVSIMQREDQETKQVFLRVNIKTKGLLFNPNLVFRPDGNRFKIEYLEGNEAVVYIEWLMDSAAPILKPVEALSATSGIEIAREINRNLMDPKSSEKTNLQRFEDLGRSPFIQAKLKATRTRKESEFLENVIQAIHKNLHNNSFDSAALERQMLLSKAQLFRKLKALTGFSTANFIRHIRLQKAAELLESTDLSIGDIASTVGFNELSYFSSSFLEAFKTSPSNWRKAHK